MNPFLQRLLEAITDSSLDPVGDKLIFGALLLLVSMGGFVAVVLTVLFAERRSRERLDYEMAQALAAALACPPSKSEAPILTTNQFPRMIRLRGDDGFSRIIAVRPGQIIPIPRGMKVEVFP